jgi:hypothetical protein
MKLIIFVGGRPTTSGHKIREFVWSPTHGCYLFGGKEWAASEFNAAYERAVNQNEDMRPRVKVVGIGAESPAPVTPVLIATRPPTVDEAVAVLQRLAPERLKAKTGPKPRLQEVS